MAVQFWVNGAPFRRGTNTRCGREGAGFPWIVGEPVMVCGSVTIVWAAKRASHGHSLPVRASVITGCVPLLLAGLTLRARRHAVVHHAVVP